MIVFDSYAWLEYFSGSEKGKIVNQIIESQEEIFTPAVCLAEIKRKYLKEKKDFKERINFILTRSKIIKTDLNISLNSAEIAEKYKLYLIDAVVYCSALSVNSQLLTGDLHFKELEKIRFLS